MFTGAGDDMPVDAVGSFEPSVVLRMDALAGHEEWERSAAPESWYFVERLILIWQKKNGCKKEWLFLPIKICPLLSKIQVGVYSPSHLSLPCTPMFINMELFRQKYWHIRDNDLLSRYKAKYCLCIAHFCICMMDGKLKFIFHLKDSLPISAWGFLLFRLLKPLSSVPLFFKIPPRHLRMYHSITMR